MAAANAVAEAGEFIGNSGGCQEGLQAKCTKDFNGHSYLLSYTVK